jgi:hypothetical protein
MTWLHRTSVAAALAVLGACGSDTPPAPTPTPTPTPTPSRTVVVSTAFTVPGGTTFSDTVDNVPAGAVDVRLEWAEAAIDLNLYVTDTACSSILDILAGGCRVLGQGTGNARPEVVNFTTTAQANYIVWVRNLSSTTQAARFELGVTR